MAASWSWTGQDRSASDGVSCSGVLPHNQLSVLWDQLRASAQGTFGLSADSTRLAYHSGTGWVIGLPMLITAELSTANTSIKGNAAPS